MKLERIDIDLFIWLVYSIILVDAIILLNNIPHKLFPFSPFLYIYLSLSLSLYLSSLHPYSYKVGWGKQIKEEKWIFDFVDEFVEFYCIYWWFICYWKLHPRAQWIHFNMYAYITIQEWQYSVLKEFFDIPLDIIRFKKRVVY